FTHDTQVLFTRTGDSVDPGYNDEWFGLSSINPIDAVTNPAGTQRNLRKSYAAMQSLWNPAAAATTSASKSFFADTVRNYPNPFRLGAATTKFVVLANEPGTVDLRIYDAGGQFVTSFKADVIPPARQEIIWDGRNSQGELVSSGLYIVQIHGQGTHE